MRWPVRVAAFFFLQKISLKDEKKCDNFLSFKK
jgi:hypothetical protein